MLNDVLQVLVNMQFSKYRNVLIAERQGFKKNESANIVT